MTPCELTFSITALANAVADKLSAEELELTAAMVTQFGDTLTTISAKRNLCDKLSKEIAKKQPSTIR